VHSDVHVTVDAVMMFCNTVRILPGGILQYKNVNYGVNCKKTPYAAV